MKIISGHKEELPITNGEIVPTEKKISIEENIPFNLPNENIVQIKELQNNVVTSPNKSITNIDENIFLDTLSDDEIVQKSELEQSNKKLYETYSYTTIGKRHVNEGLPCQDSSFDISTENYSLAVIADGHSDYHCFRSHIGSKLATEAMYEILEKELNNEKIEFFFEDADTDKEECFQKLWKDILILWKIKVANYHEKNPITNEEKENIKRSIEKKYSSIEEINKKLLEINDEPIYMIYGTTMRSAVITKYGHFFLSIGDGESILINTSGKSISPIKQDDDTFGSETHSMCDENAIKYCKYYYGKEHIIGAAVTCDGITTTSDLVYHIGEYAKEVFSEILSNQLNWKDRFDEKIKSCSSEFPYDDCSMGIILDKKTNLVNIQKKVIPLVLNEYYVNKKIKEGHSIDCSYFINIFNEYCYKGKYGVTLMDQKINDFCSKFIKILKKEKNNSTHSELFIKEFKIALQEWNREANKYEKDNPDTEEETELRLSNNLLYTNSSEKYGVSVALCINYKHESFTLLIGKGNLHIKTETSEKSLQYEVPESSAEIGFKNIIYSYDAEIIQANLVNNENNTNITLISKC